MAYSRAALHIDDKSVPLQLINGTDGTQALDLSGLGEQTGLLAFDPSLNNTAWTRSAITWIDGAHGTLLYRGVNVEELVEHSTFVETSYLLSHGDLPNEKQHKEYSTSLSKHSMIHESMRNFFDAFPGTAHPIAILATMVTALSSYYPATFEENIARGIDIKSRLLAKVRTLAAWAYKKAMGQPVIYPRDELPYCTNFLNMVFAIPAEAYAVPPEHDKILNQLLILYSDHEQNASTSTVRLVGSTKANLFACINAGLCAMWGGRESGSNLPPIPMLEAMVDFNQKPEVYFEKFIRGTEPLRSNGLGHSSYKVTDPRAVISRKLFHQYLKSHPSAADSVIDKALEVEEFATGHPYFIERRMYPNLDFYSALI
ncbi:MAG: citrate synthase, partial [Spirochaetia bacterium]|nr:citrate synthase [Spirochaetia bacterium]